MSILKKLPKPRKKLHSFLTAGIISITFILAAGFFFIRFPNKAKESEDAISDMSAPEPVNYTDVEDIELKEKYRRSDNKPEESDIPIPSEDTSEEYATSHNEERQAALSNEPVKLADIYSEAGLTAAFKCFRPDAVRYTWEVYDISAKNWIEAAPDDVSLTRDELGREVSTLRLQALDNDGLMVRCITEFPEAKGSITEIAALHVLNDVAGISVNDYTSYSDGYISIKDIPVNVTFKDGRKNTITGMNGIYFLEITETSEPSVDAYGNPVEILTIVKTSHEYLYPEKEKGEAIIRYRGGTAVIDAHMTLTMEDNEAPVILQLDISGCETNNGNAEEPASATVSIMAVDNSTPYRNLEYAFLPDTKEPDDDDWTNKHVFDVDISNGKWTAYCRDQSGNTASSARDIITADNTAPLISARLENEDTWCPANKIIVEADGKPFLEYCYKNTESEEDSGWISQAEYSISKNGTYHVYARDAAGNVSEREIIVSNIDSHAPVINAIKKKEN